MIGPTPDEPAPREALSEMERQARIEQLLVSGLDEYFAGRLDQAVNVWTRVLFLDRSNDRARAYIDRARRAQGERQRESESLVHQGLQAFDEGDVDAARALLTAAVDRGAPQEQALPVLRRIGFLEQAAGTTAIAPKRPRWRRAAPSGTGSQTGSRLWPWAIVALAPLLLGVVAWRVNAAAGPTQVRAPYEPPAAALPVPAPSEGTVRRARTLFETGRLTDALTLLERVDPADAAYGDVQALRARIQQELLRSAPGADPPPPIAPR